HGRGDPRRREPGDRPRRVGAVGCSGHGDGPPGERLPRPRRARSAGHDAGGARLPPRPRLRARRGEAAGARRRHPAGGGDGVTGLVCTAGSAAARRRLARLERRGETAGARVGQRIEPLERVGVYIPGGRAVYPSTVLMTVVTARVAGVKEVVAVSPPGKAGDHPLILAACHVAGVDRLYRLGGAQAIAALAFGTETVPRVDKIVGPGN